MGVSEESLQADVRAVAQVDAVPTILEVICRTTGMGFAAVARVSADRWIACAVRDEIAFGLKPGGELKVETTICDEIRDSGEGVVIDHVAKDTAYCGHQTPAMYGFQSYISTPIWRAADPSFFGTLCAIDPNPAKLNRPEIIAMFKLFAELISTQLALQERFSANEAALGAALDTGALRDQFIAVLSHDLRNPLAAIDAGMHQLQKETLSGKGSTTLALVRRSVTRMSELVDNVMDLARGRLGGGLPVTLRDNVDLEPTLRHVIAELQAASPGRVIDVAFDLKQPVRCDAARVGQLLSNLLGNAISHGAPDTPIRVAATSDAAEFRLSVANQGAPISPEALQQIFKPFVRGGAESQGLGLGLYIASEIARAHHGALEVISDATETRFIFSVPA